MFQPDTGSLDLGDMAWTVIILVSVLFREATKINRDSARKLYNLVVNLKGLLIGLILIVIIVLGIIQLLEALNSKRQNSPSYFQETVSLPKKVRDLTETRERQIKEREEQLGQEWLLRIYPLTLNRFKQLLNLFYFMALPSLFFELGNDRELGSYQLVDILWEFYAHFWIESIFIPNWPYHNAV